LPTELEIKISRDAWHWKDIHASKDPMPSAKNGILHFNLSKPTVVKQIWVIGRDFRGGDNNFSLADIEVVDTNGKNAALISRGTGVSVSSTNYGGGSRETYDQMWPIQYDLGVKWMRLSGSNGPYHHDTLSWRFVEQEKGKYKIDRRTDKVITEAARNGINIITILGYGNWLYAPEPIDDTIDAMRFPRPFPPAAMTPESREGYKNYARFMAKHFKGRIKYYEIWNEPSSFGFEGDDWLDKYCQLFKEVVPVIKTVDPEAKVVFGGMCGYPGWNVVWDGSRPDGWFQGFMKRGVVELMDGFGWQTQVYLWDSSDPGYIAYPENAKLFQQDMKSMGFKGIYISRENLWAAPYPNPLDEPRKDYNILGMTEIRKAKDMARMFVTNAGLGVSASNWCNTWLEQSAFHDSGLFRIAFAGEPNPPQQPQPAYYVMRTLCTVLDQTAPDPDLQVEYSNKQCTVNNFNFCLPGNKSLVALWLPGASVDAHPGIKTDLVVKQTSTTKIIGIDLINGTEQKLGFEIADGDIHIKKLLVRDYPTLLRIEH
jgi:hypothetical protein